MVFNIYIMVYYYKKIYPDRVPIDEAKVKDAIAKINSDSISIRKATKS